MLNQITVDAPRSKDASIHVLLKPMASWDFVGIGVLIAGLYITGQYSFLLFHTLAEVFSIIVACAVAMLAWNSRRHMENNYVLVIAIAFGCAGGIDLIHALSYKGMNIFSDIDANRPTQLWIASRFLLGLSFAAAPFTLGRTVNYKGVLAAYLLTTCLLLTTILFWEVFPDCFIEGHGLTRFKIASEYVICLLFGLSIYLLFIKRYSFHPDVYRPLTVALLVSILAEIAFTFYISVFGLSNMIGHIFKIISSFLIYKAVVQTGLIRPHRLMFMSLKENEASLIRVRDELEARVANRTAELLSANEHLRKSNRALRAMTDCHQAMIHDHDEKKLIDDICRIVVETAGYCFAWAGLIQRQKRYCVVPVAHRGFESGYLDELRGRDLDASVEHGIAATAASSGKVEVCNNIHSRPHQYPPHAAAVSRGYGASISLPMQIKGRIMGELNIYSAAPDAFDDHEENLLTELVNDLSYGIATLRSRKEREWALKEMDKLLFLIEQSTDLVSIISLEGEVLYLNAAGRTMLEIDNIEQISASVTLNRILRSGVDALDREILPGLMASGQWQGELELHQINTGRPIMSDANIFTIREPKKRQAAAYAAVCRDIRHRKKMEAQLRQAQKMEAIGVLAGGIAHDFNNILAAISGFAELVLNDVDEGSLQHRNIREVLLASDRAKDLVRQILTFSRHGEQENQPTQIGLYVKEALKMLRASLPATIDIRQNIQSRSLVWSDATQIHQVVMNLCTNASHAMTGKGGRLDVQLVDIDVTDTSPIRGTQLASGPYVRLIVEDSGCGMPEEVLERIFEPFYTTKADGEGTGMGLAVVHGIVNSHGGAITVDSRSGSGTRFDIYWPLAEHEAHAQHPVDAPVPTGTEKVLFVDDEVILIAMGRQMIESLGYRVAAHSSSVDALREFEADPGDFDVVITDMTMPDMGGDELAEAIIAIRPDIPIIVYTGYSNRIDEDRSRALGIRALLPKPIRKAEIAMAIRSCLDNRSSSGSPKARPPGPDGNAPISTHNEKK